MVSRQSSSIKSFKKEESLVSKLFKMLIWKRIDVPLIKMYERGLRRKLYILVLSPIFTTFMMIIIILNAFTLAMDRYPNPPENQAAFLKYSNYVFTLIFSIDLILKLFALELSEFFKDRFNLFDTVVVLLSFVEILLSLDSEDQGNSALGALRVFRLFRLFKIFKLSDLRILIETIS